MSSPLFVAPLLGGGEYYEPYQPFDPVEAAVDEALNRRSVELDLHTERVLAHYKDTDDFDGASLQEAATPYYASLASTVLQGIGLLRGFESRPGALAPPKGSIARAAVVLQGVLDNETICRWDVMDDMYAEATNAPMKRFAPVRRGGPMEVAAQQAGCRLRCDDETNVVYTRHTIHPIDSIERALEQHDQELRASWIKNAVVTTVAGLTEPRLMVERAILQDTIERYRQRPVLMRRLGQIMGRSA